MARPDRPFGRRSAQDDDFRAEPTLSFSPRSGGRDDRTRDDRARDDRGPGPLRGRKARSQEPSVDEADRPIHLREDAKGSRAFGWIALGAMLVIVGGVYAWHFYTPAASAPAAQRAQGYTTPQQATPGSADNGSGNPPPAQSLGAAGQVTTPPFAPPPEPAAQSVATAPEPKSLPPTPVAPPRKTISDAAAEHPLTATTPDTAPATPPATPAHDTAKPKPPRKSASLDVPDVAKSRAPAASPEPPMPNLPAPRPTAQAAAPPAVAVPQTFSGPAATGAPQSLNRASAPANQNGSNQSAAATPTPSLAPFLHPQTTATPATAAPPAGTATSTVTVDGVTYVSGEEPHALGTVATPSPDASTAPTLAPPPAPASSAGGMRPYIPSHGASLPNDVIIAPNGQMSVPSGSP